jgi:predicted nuclease of restriction endonuclease-like (RecB) superfamily
VEKIAGKLYERTAISKRPPKLFQLSLNLSAAATMG